MGLNSKLYNSLSDRRSGVKKQVVSSYAWSWNKLRFINKGNEIGKQLKFNDNTAQKLKKYQDAQKRITQYFTSSKIIKSFDLHNQVDNQSINFLIISILNDILEYKKRRRIYKKLCDRSEGYKTHCIRGHNIQ